MYLETRITHPAHAFVCILYSNLYLVISECHQCSVRPNTEQTKEMHESFGGSVAVTGSYLAQALRTPRSHCFFLLFHWSTMTHI